MTGWLCVVTSRHDPGKTPRAAPGLRTCRGHRHKVEQMIAELPALHEDLGLRLTAAGADTRLHEQVTGSAVPGLQLNERIVDARDEIHSELVRIVRYVVDGNRLTRWPADTVTSMATWLGPWVDWLCTQPDADETHDYLDRLAGYTWLGFPSGRRFITLPDTVCATPIYCDVATRQVVTCVGGLVGVLPADDDRMEMADVRCDSCGLDVPATGWEMWRDRWKRGAA